jgi:hypothetical protein
MLRFFPLHLQPFIRATKHPTRLILRMRVTTGFLGLFVTRQIDKVNEGLESATTPFKIGENPANVSVLLDSLINKAVR